ncbi:putative ABC transporter D family member 2 [Blattamonas nauphoetae]|uniref:ABC transporter D family member 2 n=1 Tax=Blattamonas nauphoetae TaxID=2049346 RepID=A0ABQ9YFQ8_9EUKA|nr:putative ABC transporter D family member 2 [Blattamonas nauphoetae]
MTRTLDLLPSDVDSSLELNSRYYGTNSNEPLDEEYFREQQAKQQTHVEPKMRFWKRFFRILRMAHPSPRFFSFRGSLLLPLIIAALVGLYTLVLNENGLIRGNFSKAIGDLNPGELGYALFHGILYSILCPGISCLMYFVQALIFNTTRYSLVHILHDMYLDESLAFYKLNYFYPSSVTADQRITQDASRWAECWAEVVSKSIDTPIQIIYYNVQAIIKMGWVGPIGVLAFYVVVIFIVQFLIRPLIRMMFYQSTLEGKFRRTHVKLLDDADAIALMGTRLQEKELLTRAFQPVFYNSIKVSLWNFAVRILSLVGSNVSYVIAYTILAWYAFKTDYFKQAETPGALAQLISDSIFLLRTLADNYANILKMFNKYSEMAAYTNRVGHFTELCEEMRKDYISKVSTNLSSDEAVEGDQAAEEAQPIVEDQSNAEEHEQEADSEPNKLLSVSVDGLSVYSPTLFTPFISLLSTTLFSENPAEQHRLLIVGPNGIGKSTLFRTLAGIWPFAAGRIGVKVNKLAGSSASRDSLTKRETEDQTPPDAPPIALNSHPDIMFVPQQPHLPFVSLAALLSYPNDPSPELIQVIQSHQTKDSSLPRRHDRNAPHQLSNDQAEPGTGMTPLLPNQSPNIQTASSPLLSPASSPSEPIPSDIPSDIPRPFANLGESDQPQDIPPEPLQLDIPSIFSLLRLPHILSHKPPPDFDWSSILSPGEQQLICFARVLIQRPKLAFLDEATSALSPEMEIVVYDSLRRANIAFHSIAHRQQVMNYHTHKLALKGEGQWDLTSITENSHQL